MENKKCSKPPTSKHVFSLDCGFCLMQKNIHQQKCQKYRKRSQNAQNHQSSLFYMILHLLQCWPNLFSTDSQMSTFETWSPMHSYELFQGNIYGKPRFLPWNLWGSLHPQPSRWSFFKQHFGSSVELQRILANGRPRSQKSRTSWCSALKSSKEFSWMGGFSDITLRWVYVNMICC